jgi:predicted deacylase
MASGYRLAIPIHVVNGRENGPVSLICAASHGEEVWSTEFCRRVKSHFENALDYGFRGTILIAPVLNPLSFETGHRNTPIDLHNLNRVFPGTDRGKGWFTDHLASVIAEGIVSHADYVFDYHGGGQDTVIHYTYTVPPDSERNRRIHEVALASGAEILWEHFEARGTLTNYAEQLGKLCIVPEVGGGGVITDLTTFPRAIEDLKNMLKVLEVLPGDVAQRAARVVVRQGGTVRPGHGGTFVPEVGIEVLGKTIPGGTVLGNVISPYTFEVLDTLIAPYPKTEILQLRNRISKVHPGEYAYIVGDGDSGYAVASEL